MFCVKKALSSITYFYRLGSASALDKHQEGAKDQGIRVKCQKTKEQLRNPFWVMDLSQEVGPRFRLPPSHIVVQELRPFSFILSWSLEQQVPKAIQIGLVPFSKSFLWGGTSVLSKQGHKKGDSKYIKHQSQNTHVHHWVSIREVKPFHFTCSCRVCGHLINWPPTWVYSWPWDLYWLCLFFPNPYASGKTSGYFSS